MSTTWREPSKDGLDPTRIVLAVRSAAHDYITMNAAMEVIQDDSMILYDVVRSCVRKAGEASNDEQPVWRDDVLQPIVDEFADESNLSTDSDDTEYVLLICTVVFLVYEILHQREACFSKADGAFIDEILVECLQESEVYTLVCDAVEAEYARLGEIDESMSVLNALWMLSARLSAISTIIPPMEMEVAAIKSLSLDTEGKPRMSHSLPYKTFTKLDEDRISNRSRSAAASAVATSSNHHCSPKPPQDPSKVSNTSKKVARSTSVDTEHGSVANAKRSSRNSEILDHEKPTGRATFSDHNVLVQIYLRPGRGLKINYVDSISVWRRIFTLKTSQGLTILLEEGIEASPPSGERDTVTIRGDGCACALTGSIIIPSGCSFTFHHVESFEYVDAAPMTGKIDTDSAVLYVGNGVYHTFEDEGQKRLTIRNP
jgi:hypothetical protein